MSSHKAVDTRPSVNVIARTLTWLLHELHTILGKCYSISANCSAGSFSSVFTAYQRQCAVFGRNDSMLYIHLASIPIGYHTAKLAFLLRSTRAKHALGG